MENGGDEIDEARRASEVAGPEIAAPAPEIDAGEDELLAAAFGEAANIFEAGFERDGAAGSARSGNDAEGAAIVAAVLHLEVGPGLVRGGGEGQRGEFGVGEVFIYENLRGRLRNRCDGTESRRATDACCDLGRQSLVAIADDRIHALKGGDFVRGALGIAAGNDDPGLGIASVDAADKGAGCAVCFRGDAAGV